MGCKAEGAAQGYTVLGGIVLLILALNDLRNGISQALGGSFDGTITVVLAIVLILLVVLSFDACGFTHITLHRRSGLLLAIFGLVAIIIVIRGLSFDIIGWLMNVGTLAGFMILVAGILIMVNK
jgi:hypothetical protein